MHSLCLYLLYEQRCSLAYLKGATGRDDELISQEMSMWQTKDEKDPALQYAFIKWNFN